MAVGAIVVVSDVHLDGTPQARRQDDALSRFIGHVAAGEVGATSRLIALGDVFDLLAVQIRGQGQRRRRFTETTALAASDELLHTHRQVVDALRHAVAAGITVDFVAGNHDIDISRPAVQARFRAALGGTADAVGFHPWLYHLPGVLYAEHGHHHHDLNASATALLPYTRRDGRLSTVPGAWLDGGGHGAAAPVIAAGIGQRVRRMAVRRTDAYRRALACTARDTLLPETVVGSLDRLGATPGVALAGRAIRQRLKPTPTGTPTQIGGYLHRAARGVDRVLAAAGANVPCYLFGHTHIAEVFPLSPGGPLYANSGTWSSAVPKGLDEHDGRRYTFLRIEPEDGSVELLRWDERGHVIQIDKP